MSSARLEDGRIRDPIAALPRAWSDSVDCPWSSWHGWGSVPSFLPFLQAPKETNNNWMHIYPRNYAFSAQAA